MRLRFAHNQGMNNHFNLKWENSSQSTLTSVTFLHPIKKYDYLIFIYMTAKLRNINLIYITSKCTTFIIINHKIMSNNFFLHTLGRICNNIKGADSSKNDLLHNGANYNSKNSINFSSILFSSIIFLPLNNEQLQGLPVTDSSEGRSSSAERITMLLISNVSLHLEGAI